MAYSFGDVVFEQGLVSRTMGKLTAADLQTLLALIAQVIG
jgi:hypothetical protein